MTMPTISVRALNLPITNLKVYPFDLVMGGRDLENNTMEVMRRDTLEKETRSCDGIEEYVQNLLEEIQNNILSESIELS